MDFCALDTKLFFFINHGLKNPVFDFIMPIITDIKYWRIPLVLGAIGLFAFGGKKGRELGIICIITLAFTDQFVNKMIKPYVNRLRPCDDLLNVYQLVNTGAESFPSSHAVNTFAQAALIFHYYKKAGIIAGIIALVVAFSRVYVGVHYPFDVLSGIFMGIYFAIVALILAQLTKNIISGFKKGKNAQN